MLEFDIVDKHSNVTHYQFPVGSYTLGKGDVTDVILNDSHVSRVHAIIEVSNVGAVLVDENSTNGTWYKNSRLVEPLKLSKGDSIYFGELQLLIKAIPQLANDPFGGDERTVKVVATVQESEELVALKRRLHTHNLENLDSRKR